MTDAAKFGGHSVAVVMCTYNGERFLVEQLDSVFAQSKLPDHVVIVDDASTDGTFRLVERRCAQRPPGIRLTLERNARNVGYVANFERALGLAHEDLLFLCDQDDVWHPNKIERMTREFDARPDLDLLHTDARLVDADGASLGCRLFEAVELSASDRVALHAGRGFEVVLRHSVVTGATAAIRRSAVRRAVPFPAHWVHDEWLAITCAMTGRMDCLEDVLIDYRQHDRNQIGMRKRTARQRLSAGDSRRGLMQRIEARLEQLVERIQAGAIAVDEDRFTALQDRLRHARVRAHLPASAGRRVGLVFAEALRGGYARHSFGMRSVAADVLGLR